MASEVVVVVWRVGSEEEDNKEKEAPALRRHFGSPSRGPSGAFLVLVRYLSRAVCQSFRGPLQAVLWQEGALRTTIMRKDGDDSQRVNRVIQACGTHCLICCVDLVRAPLNPEESQTCGNNSQKLKLTCCSTHHSFRTHHAALVVLLLDAIHDEREHLRFAHMHQMSDVMETPAPQDGSTSRKRGHPLRSRPRPSLACNLTERRAV